MIIEGIMKFFPCIKEEKIFAVILVVDKLIVIVSGVEKILSFIVIIVPIDI